MALQRCSTYITALDQSLTAASNTCDGFTWSTANAGRQHSNNYVHSIRRPHLDAIRCRHLQTGHGAACPPSDVHHGHWLPAELDCSSVVNHSRTTTLHGSERMAGTDTHELSSLLFETLRSRAVHASEHHSRLLKQTAESGRQVQASCRTQQQVSDWPVNA